ncbi:hypothetical protein CEXT_584401 [Caerostris extrusa]|uniref:Uncharacterized protein n=1 Tax=Caerostris extrusa TaxID=172846 RepID=A0AAV4MMB5_CAEEX|nr:hypothetical protein CEXT_584401 [Caerostris extrusa]
MGIFDAYLNTGKVMKTKCFHIYTEHGYLPMKPEKCCQNKKSSEYIPGMYIYRSLTQMPTSDVKPKDYTFILEMVFLMLISKPNE